MFVDDIDNDNADDDHDMYDVLVTFIMMMIFHDHDDDYVKRKGGVCMLGDVVIGRFSVKKNTKKTPKNSL